VTLTREELGVSAGAVVIDVGCAGGVGTAALRRSGCQAIGVELEQHLLHELRSRPETAALPAVRGDGARLPIATGSVAGACIIEVLEHVPDTRPMLAELRRILPVGGRLCVAVPSAYTERAYDRLHPRYTSNAGHLHRFERPLLTALLEEAGFRLERVDTRNLAPAIAWYVHALLRTDADPTGRALQHRWVDVVVHGGIRVLRRIPGAAACVRWLDGRLGKSWYFHCAAT
jgi:SAM-dependent methyltransferase